MSYRYGKLMVAMTVLALLPGCAALINGPTQDIAINTNPPGAECRLTRENMVIATVPHTPAIVRVNRSLADIIVECRRDGHADAQHQMQSSIDGAVFANLLGPGLTGVNVDSATGADRKYDSAVTLTLLPATGKPATAEQRQVAQAGDVSQASWIVQRTASTNASQQVPTAPVGYVPPQPEKQPEKQTETSAEAKPVAAVPAPVPKPAPSKPVPSKPAATAMKASPSSAGSGLWRAHLASHRTEGAAINEWQELLKKDPKLYGEFDPKIEWIDVKDRGSFARLLVGGWPERKEADAACAKIRGPQRYCAAIKE